MTTDLTALTAPTAPPFSSALAVEPVGDGRYTAELGPDWAVGPKAHGGFLIALLVKAGLARLATEGPAVDPVAVSTDFLRAPDLGSVELATDVVKLGRTVSVVAVRMLQNGRTMLTATVTGGALPDTEPLWADLPDVPAEPPADAIDRSAEESSAFRIARVCDLRLDEPTAAFVRGEKAPPVLRGWARPRGEPADVLFALVAGDILPPTVFNVTGAFGWAPTVQLTAFLRARPASGWLRIESRTAAVTGQWFDEDVTVVDEAGRIVCQARQLALTPAR
ncbi:thioesterase family protein [Pseudonocardia sp. TRM90224]|uniref:thioesterase family protein n=1 Tax=Pseudonocardia sp. TRM90224 TaxID=2812678 RepID=UPI001E60F76F|nr:thioesterase family protein [Pseudonocardia sp. TRM90224]